jgi:hypothetical protein
MFKIPFASSKDSVCYVEVATTKVLQVIGIFFGADLL